ncbi:MAG: hypothetical protein HWE11_12860 [Gammaproteobacteria bacterium]|nr:hypothetical protein [Gammaproteobacteria bacterium]
MKVVYGFIVILLTTGSTHLAAKKSGFDLGVAYDLDVGVTAQFNHYSLFFNSDAVAFDANLETFYNSKKSAALYIDFGAFYQDREANNDTFEDRVGIRLPIGVTFGLGRNVEAYIQAVPHYDFNNDKDFDVDGAIGVRYQF